MKKKQGLFFSSAVLLAAAIFTLAGCGDSGSGDPSSPPDGEPAKAAMPTASPAAGRVDSGTAITLSTATSGAAIRYTTDGTNPTSTSGAVYSDSNKPAITTDAAVKAVAYKDGMTDSDILTAVYTVNDPLSFFNPPDTVADAAAAKAYFQTIWDGLPPEWQTFFMTMWAKEGAAGGGVVPTRLDELRDEIWEEMVYNWSMYRSFWPRVAEKINAGESPIAAPPVWPTADVQIKGYVESIWESLTEGWRAYYLKTITRYYNYNKDDIDLPANLAAVPDAVWAYMRTAWNGSIWKPQDAQSIFERLALAVNMGFSPDDENLELFIYAG